MRHRPRAAARPRRRHALAAAATLLVLAVGVPPLLGSMRPEAEGRDSAGATVTTSSGDAAATAGDRTLRAAEDATTQDRDPALALSALAPAISRPGDTLTATLTVTNPTDEVLEGAQVTLWVNWQLILTRTNLQRWVDGEITRSGAPQGLVDVGPLAPGESREVTVAVPVDGLQLEGAARGPRELALTLRNSSGVLDTVRTFFVWCPDAEPVVDETPVRLSLLAPVTGPPVDPLNLLDTRELAGSVAPGGRLARVLSAVGVAEHATTTRGALGLAVDPALVATALASSDPQVVAWADAAAAAADHTEVAALPAFDPDLGALARADLSDRAAVAATTASLPADWAVPESWSTPLAWPVGTPDPGTLELAAAADLGTVVVTSGLAPVRGTWTGLATVDTNTGPVTALVADQPITDTLLAGTDTADGAPAQSRAEAVQRLLAETAVISQQADGTEPHLLVAFPRTWDPDVEALGTALTALHASGWVRLAPLSELLAASEPDVDRQDLAERDAQDDDLDATSVRRLDAARAGVEAIAAVADDPQSVLAEVGPGLVAPTAVAWRRDPELRAAVVEAAIGAADQLRRGLSVSINTEATLISAHGSLPITVHNSLPSDATVTVELRPGDSRLLVEERPTPTVPAGSEVRLQVPVSALASGDVTVEVRLLAPDGTPVAEPVSMQLRVRAGWETAGTAVVAGAVALLFVAGIWRTVRRGRSSRRTTEDALVDPVIPADLRRDDLRRDDEGRQ